MATLTLRNLDEKVKRKLQVAAILFALIFACARPLAAYSLLTHEQLIDLTWACLLYTSRCV